MTKLIFLDIDGVLITSQSKTKPDPQCVTNLNWLTNETGGKIVVSSTWRKAGRSEIAEKLRKWGVTGEVIDVTPVLDKQHNGVWTSPARGDEIRAYLLYWPVSTNFVILDDESDMGYLMPWLVQTSYDTGLLRTDCIKGKALLEAA